MDLYKTNKYQSKYENLLYMSRKVFEIIEKPITIDILFYKLEKQVPFTITPEFESIIFLSLGFLYSVGLIDFQENHIQRSFL